nr:hypothetical protein [Candidatus Microthrix sp.]
MSDVVGREKHHTPLGALLVMFEFFYNCISAGWKVVEYERLDIPPLKHPVNRSFAVASWPYTTKIFLTLGPTPNFHPTTISFAFLTNPANDLLHPACFLTLDRKYLFPTR